MDTEKNEPLTDLGPLLTDLYYPSESDEPLEYRTFTETIPAPLTPETLRPLIGAGPETRVEEISEERFWEPVLTEQDWYGEDEKAVVQRFRTLQAEVTRLLADRQVFRVGETEVDLYLLGRDPAGTWAGLKTMVVET